MRINTRTFSFLFSAFLILFIGTISSVAAQDNAKRNSDEQILTDLIKQMTTAQANFDAATLDKIYASDYIEVSPIGEIDQREKAIGFYKSENNSDAGKMKMVVTADEFLIRSYKDFAVVIARFTFAPSENTVPARPPVTFRATVVCRKEKRMWKISSVQATGIRPSRPSQAK